MQQSGGVVTRSKKIGTTGSTGSEDTLSPLRPEIIEVQNSPQTNLRTSKGKRRNRSKKESPNMAGKGDEPKQAPDGETKEEKWERIFSQLDKTLKNLTTEVTELKGMKGKVEAFSKEWKETIDSHVEKTETVLEHQEFRINWLTNIVIKQDQKIKELEGKIEGARYRELKPNLIIRGIIEEESETREQLFAKCASFFKNQVQIEEEIELMDAYRMGEGYSANKY